MAKGKSTYCTWYCTQCNQVLGISYYKKSNDPNKTVIKEKKMFCNKCRAHKVAKRKDTKKG